MKRILFSLFLITLVIYFLTSAGTTPYNQFTLLADAFLKGKLYIEGVMPWLEKVPLDATRFYVVNPPMPAIVALPFVFIFGKEFPQQYIAHLLGAMSVVIWFMIAHELTKNKTKAIYISLLVGFGNIFWYLVSVGSIWYLGQVTGFFFLSLAIYENMSRKRSYILAPLLLFAYLSRIQLLLSLPFFIFTNTRSKKNIAGIIISLISFAFLYGLYNFARFGNIFQAGYTLIPGITNEPWFNKGPFSLSYIPSHLQILLFALPRSLTPNLSGLAIWFTTPAFIYAFIKIKSKEIFLSFTGILLIGFINFSYGSTGISQFGYRYAVDFYPFLFLLISYSLTIRKLKWHHYFLLFLSISVNAWGVILLNKFL